MKKNRIYKLIPMSSLFAVILTGCAPSYNIEPKYNEETKVLDIAGKKFTKTLLSQSKDPIDSSTLQFRTKIRLYQSKDEECDNIYYRNMVAGERAYISDNMEIYLRDKYTIKNNGNGKCNVTKFGNVRFFNCFTTKGKYYTEYFITTRKQNEYGYKRIDSIKLDRKCFFNIFWHFNEKAKIDGVKKVEYNLE